MDNVSNKPKSLKLNKKSLGRVSNIGSTPMISSGGPLSTILPISGCCCTK